MEQWNNELNMKISAKKYAQTLYELTENKDKKEIETVLDNFVKTLVANRDTRKVEEIIEQFREIWNKKNQIVEAQAVTSTSVDEETLKVVKDYIEEATQAKEVMLDHDINENILGGVIMRYKDKVVDASLANQVKQLKNKLVK